MVRLPTLRVDEVHRESTQVLSFTLANEDRSALPRPLLGQFLVFKIRPENVTETVLRNYSISGPSQPESFRVSIRRAEGSVAGISTTHVQQGELLQVSAPEAVLLSNPARFRWCC
jgi:ferredoxin-NADP reductase